MRKIVFLATMCAALVQASAAAAMTSQECKQFISGTWTSKPGDKGASVSVTYDVGGTYRQDGGSKDAHSNEALVESGSWDAQETDRPRSCTLSLTPTGAKPRTFAVEMVDHDTIKADDGTLSTRTAGTMEPQSSP